MDTLQVILETVQNNNDDIGKVFWILVIFIVFIILTKVLFLGHNLNRGD